MRHGGQILVDQLLAQSVDTVFCVPGESFLAALDGLHDAGTVKTIVCRQEGGAAMMAEADAKLTGRPGVCFVTRGPGATNASIGVHIARQDSTPMVMFVGLPAQAMEDREAFQEFDFKAMFGALAKWAAVVPETGRLPEYISQAFHVATSGRPGPVVIGLPEDILSAAADTGDAKAAQISQSAPAANDIGLLRQALSRAERPLVIVGGPGWSESVRLKAQQFAARFGLPVAASFRCQDYFDNTDPHYVGHVGIGIEPTLAAAVSSADVLIVIGARLGEMTTSGYTLVTAPEPRQFLVHVHPDPSELGRVYRPDVPIASSAEAFFDAALTLDVSASSGWGAHRETLRAAYDAFCIPQPTPGDIRMEDIVVTLDDMLADDAIITNGAGNYTAWVHRYRRYRRYRTQLAPTAGAMGYGVPAGVAAAIRSAASGGARQIVTFAGDGCFLMNAQELATAAQYGVRLLMIVANNGMYGTIRMHQEKNYPGRVMGTSLANPDFVAYANAFGGDGEVLRRTEDIRSALQRGLTSEVPYLIEVPIDQQALTPKQTLDEIARGA
ncbi:MAG: thiamine pyrophosphate-binding protein [Pseudomonadota bacterium]